MVFLSFFDFTPDNLCAFLNAFFAAGAVKVGESKPPMEQSVEFSVVDSGRDTFPRKCYCFGPKAMIRRDYILRMIEEFIQVLARIDSLKKGQLWQEADGVIDTEFIRLVGVGAQVVSQMSETELLAKIIQNGPTQVVHHKMRLLTTLLNQAGDIAIAQNRLEESRACYLRGLNLALETLAHSEASDFPEFVPKVEAFMIALQNYPLPLSTQVRLMQHYERIGAFGKAEDALFAMLETELDEPKLLDFGITYYQRLESQSDASLTAGNLTRAELNAGLAELERRKKDLAQS